MGEPTTTGGREMSRIRTHIRGNLVGYLALFVSLGGSSYAAITLPASSVGTKQLRTGAVTSKKIANGSITPSKLNGQMLGGSIRNWAHVAENGQVLAGSRGIHATLAGAEYTLTWGTKFSSGCAAFVSAAAVPGTAPIADSTGVGVGDSKGKTMVYVWTYSQGTPTPAPFNVAVVC
jgi:hypothetical protein